MEVTVRVLGEQAELATARFELVMDSRPVTLTQLPMDGYDAGKFCNAKCTYWMPDAQ